MHVVFRESHGLDQGDQPFDLQQDPADLVVLSFSDSDLGAFAAGWHRADDTLPSLRLANLVALKHPLSVDVYAENTLRHAKGILVRVIGGEAYWPYGLSTLQDLARRQNIALAVLPADGRPDTRLDALSTLPVSTLRRLSHLCDTGGAVAAQAALAQLALASGLYCEPVLGEKTVPDMGFYCEEFGIVDQPDTCREKPCALVTFYRSYLTSADTSPIDALLNGLKHRGFRPIGYFAPSLKAPGVAEHLERVLRDLRPQTIINATAFSAQSKTGNTPFEASDCPVFQVALSTARKKDWRESERGLSPADLAMHVVLPEVDGRLFAGVASFKQPQAKDPQLQFSRFAHCADEDRIHAVLDKVSGWHKLSQLTPQNRRLGYVLSTYPGRDDQIAHAVGLDALASCLHMLHALQTNDAPAWTPKDLAEELLSVRIRWPLEAYKRALATQPDSLQRAVQNAWGAPERDASAKDGMLHFRAIKVGQSVVALQPERGRVSERVDDYHDLARTPCHGYVAFYLWLQTQIDALLHIGAHGTLEWLPGKSVALSDRCWPERLTGQIPVIYPFIVNDPGEAAQAKRRISAVTLGHLPPPLTKSSVPNSLQRLEHLLDEYSTADGLDPARRDRLINDITAEAAGTGVADDLGLDATSSPAEAITRIDSFVCDIKESQFGDGLHVFGNGACGTQEMAGLRAAVEGRYVPPGPSGSPYRGRDDVMPTGRNLFTTDPRAVPSRAAHAQGVKLAEELLRKHLQDNGDWPKGLVVDLWGSATMRTAGEEFAMALHLAGLAPKWDEGSYRVSGFEILPLALLNRPRIDVTLRVSGLFRDVFPGLAQFFETACDALANRDESPQDNPYLARVARVFAPQPGHYGVNISEHMETYTQESRRAAGEAWLNASSYAIDKTGNLSPARQDLENRLQTVDSFVHMQDLPETDLLLASDYAAHEAGFAAAMAALGQARPAMYHLDATRPDRPKARTLPEEIARTVHARASNPNWAEGMMRHGFRGAGEIAATLDHLAAFAHLAGVVGPHLFDAYFDATLARDDVVAFMQAQNPRALDAMRGRFQALHDAGLWRSRRNSIIADMETAS